MYVLIQDSKVIYGPAHWNQMFAYHCKSLGEFTLPETKTDDAPIEVSDTIRVLSVTETIPAVNPKTEQLAGPFWIFSNIAEANYNVVPKNIDAVKNELKAQVAETRYRQEIKGTKTTIQSQEVSLLTSREDRGMYLQAFQLGASQTWKFNTVWLTLSHEDLGLIVSAVAAYVQECFTWENTKASAIDACTTLEELNTLELVYPGETLYGQH
jgi:hypothetical protein